jgi:hypothetical protein
MGGGDKNSVQVLSTAPHKKGAKLRCAALFIPRLGASSLLSIRRTTQQVAESPLNGPPLGLFPTEGSRHATRQTSIRPALARLMAQASSPVDATIVHQKLE